MGAIVATAGCHGAPEEVSHGPVPLVVCGVQLTTPSMSGTALVSATARDFGHGGVFYVNDGCRDGGTVTVRPAGSEAVTVIARDPHGARLRSSSNGTANSLPR